MVIYPIVVIIGRAADLQADKSDRQPAESAAKGEMIPEMVGVDIGLHVAMRDDIVARRNYRASLNGVWRVNRAHGHNGTRCDDRTLDGKGIHVPDAAMAGAVHDRRAGSFHVRGRGSSSGVPVIAAAGAEQGGGDEQRQRTNGRGADGFDNSGGRFRRIIVFIWPPFDEIGFRPLIPTP